MARPVWIALEGLVRRAAWYLSRPRSEGWTNATIRAAIEQVRPGLTRTQLNDIMINAKQGRDLRSYFEEQIRRSQKAADLPLGKYGYLGSEDWGDYKPGRYQGKFRSFGGHVVGIEVAIFGHLPNGQQVTWTETYNIGEATTLEEIRQHALQVKRYAARGARGGGYIEVTPDEVLLRGSAWVPYGAPTATFA